MLLTLNDGQTTIASFPQAWAVSTATATGTVAADGILAHVTLDTTGFSVGSGPFSFSVTDPLGTPTDFAGVVAELTAGQIEIVPEPSGGSAWFIAMLVLCLRLRPAWR